MFDISFCAPLTENIAERLRLLFELQNDNENNFFAFHNFVEMLDIAKNIPLQRKIFWRFDLTNVSGKLGR